MNVCLTDENNFIFVFQFYNKTGCPLQKKKYYVAATMNLSFN